MQTKNTHKNILPKGQDSRSGQPIINIYGTYIEHIDKIEHFHAGSGSHDQNITNTQVNTSVTHPADDLTSRLVPIFKGNADEVRQFVAAIKNRKDTTVTAFVNTLVREGKIFSEYKNKPLWMLLHESGYYSKTLQNWNDQID